MTLDDLMARLSAHKHVDGIVLMGSTGTASFNAQSDYDLLVVLDDPSPPLFLVATEIQGQAAELYFVATDMISEIIAAEDLEALANDRLQLGGALLEWIGGGRIVFDRRGRLMDARRRLAGRSWFRLAIATERYQSWFSVNYNLRQTARMLASSDPVYQTAVDIRLLYTLMDLLLAYFRLRDLPWPGEKKAVRHLETHDPDFLARLRDCLAEPDRNRKFDLYTALAAQTVAPVGDLWPDGATAIQLAEGIEATPKHVAEAHDYWSRLLGAEPDARSLPAAVPDL
jgi:hypothetical protein